MQESEGSNQFPNALRVEAAEAYECLHPAIREGRWRDAAATARRILTMVRDWSNDALPIPVRIEKAWSYYAAGMEARDAGRLGEAVSSLRTSANVLPGQLWPSATAKALQMLASVQEECGRVDQSIAILKELVPLFHNEPQRRGVIWFAIGCSHERCGAREQAIKAYSLALDEQHDRRVSGTDEWRHKARAGIARCQIGDAYRSGTFWDAWCKAGLVCRLMFAVLSLAAIAMYTGAVLAVVSQDYVAAKWWLVLSGMAVAVMLLPVLRRLSGSGVTLELQERDDVAFAIALKDAPTATEVLNSGLSV